MSDLALQFESYQQDLKTLSLEIESYQEVVTSLSQIVPKAQNLINSIVDRLTLDRQVAVQINDASRTMPDLKRALAAQRILDYDRTLAVVPSGFKGRLPEYIEWLTQKFPIVAKDVTENIATVNMFMAVFLTDRETKRSNIDIRPNLVPSKKRLELIQTELKSLWFTHPNPDNNRQPIATILNRFADLDELMKSVRKLDSVCTSAGLHTIERDIKKLSERLSYAADQLAKIDKDQVSGESAQNIADTVYTLARQVEFLSVLRYHAETGIQAALALIEQLDRLTNQ